MIAIDNLNGSGGTVDLSNIYNNLKNLNSAVSELESLTSYGNDISNLKTQLSDFIETYEHFTIGIVDNVLPIVVSNSSNIESLSSSINDLKTLSSLTSYENDISILNLNASILSSSINDLSQIVVSNSANIDLLKTSLFTLDYEVSNINSSLSDITNSLTHMSQNFEEILTTINGVYTANSFNNQAFNTTLNLNSDMFITGQFGLNSGSINCNNGIWDLKELKKTFLGSITAKNLSNLEMNNFNLSYCDFSFSNKCNFEDCNLTQCAITGNFINLDNCKISKCLFDDRKIEFKNITFSNTISFYNGGNLSFNNINFSANDLRFGLFSSKYRIYIYNCSINGNTSATGAFGNMFTNGGSANWEFAFM